MRTPSKTIGFLLCLLPTVASAGGFDIPDVGTEALGRGGAFVAKADSGLALYYNVAGLARQKGTRAMLDFNFIFHNMAFTREGKYPGDPADPRTPWAGQDYPKISNGAGFGYQPFLAVSTQVPSFENLTMSLGVFSPPGTGTRRYGVRRDYVAVKDQNGVITDHPTTRYEVELPPRDVGAWGTPPTALRAPSPGRYDVGETSTTILFPTLGAAYHVHKMLDVGAAVHWVVGQVDSTRATLAPFGATQCGDPKLGYQGDNGACDAYSNLKGNAQSIGFSFSALAHPLKYIDAGLTVRPQINIDAQGTITPYPTAAAGTAIDPFPATFSIKLPTIVRAGVRWVNRHPDGTERADLEVDYNFENWSVEDAVRVRSEEFAPGKPGRIVGDHLEDPDPNDTRGKLINNTPHKFLDVHSIRVGGAYNHPISDTRRFIARAGIFYESPTTRLQDTHLDAYTTEKVGFTLGVGLKLGGFTLNLAYAALWMPVRVVTGSTTLRPASSTNGTLWEPSDPTLYVNNGRYESSIHTVSLGMAINFDEVGRSSLFPN